MHDYVILAYMAFQFNDGRLRIHVPTKSRFVDAVRQVLSTIGLNPLATPLESEQ